MLGWECYGNAKPPKDHGFKDRIKKHKWNKPEWDTDHMTADQTKSFVSVIIDCVCIAMFIYGSITIICW
jgi:hypothetical protein